MQAPDGEHTGWDQSHHLLGQFLGEGRRLDHLLQDSRLESEEAARCRFFLSGTIRNLSLLEAALDGLIPRRPRRRVWAILLLGAFEILEKPEDAPKIVHFAVEQGKRRVTKPECGLINSVLRRISGPLAKMVQLPGDDPASLSLRYSHPEWLVERWLAAFGVESTRSLLAWDQQPGPVYARLRKDTPIDLSGAVETRWPDFVEIGATPWSEISAALNSGTIYIQDPATRLAPDLLGLEGSETVLDLCAAPGGKTLQLAERLASGGGRVVSVDLPGAKSARLYENVNRRPDLPVTVIESDVRRLDPKAFLIRDLPEIFDGVLIDVPCSNTGVLRHRVDAKWRLRERDIEKLTRLQTHLLGAAARFVRPGGKLVYSTCSLEAEENDGVVEAFVRAQPEFERIEGGISQPWCSGHDGAGCFLLGRTSARG